MSIPAEFYANEGRQRKAAALVLEIDKLFSTLRIESLAIATVKSWTQVDWDTVAHWARVRSPSPETQALVIELLEKRAERRSA